MSSGTRRTMTAVLIVVTSATAASWPGDAAAESMRIRIKINETEVVAGLTDNATSRDFVALLPLRLTLEDYGDIEKISTLPRKLSTEGAPAGSTPSVGDVSYYAPWGNLAFFRKDFRYSSGLIRLGQIESGLEAMNVTGPVDVLIERLGQ